MVIFSSRQSRMQYYRDQSYDLRSQAEQSESVKDWDEAARLRKLADDAEYQAQSLQTEISESLR